MADDPINLNKARKARARAAAKKTAQENRAKFGQTGHSRRAKEKSRSAEVQRLDGHKLEKD
ncbi:MAG: DUF4169 family protein [Pseudomonadota bacterium]